MCNVRVIFAIAGIKSGAPPTTSAGGSRQRRISSDSSNSSSIDADIFQKLFPGKYLDDELFNEGSGSKPQDGVAAPRPPPPPATNQTMPLKRFSAGRAANPSRLGGASATSLSIRWMTWVGTP